MSYLESQELFVVSHLVDAILHLVRGIQVRRYPSKKHYNDHLNTDDVWLFLAWGHIT